MILGEGQLWCFPYPVLRHVAASVWVALQAPRLKLNCQVPGNFTFVLFLTALILLRPWRLDVARCVLYRMVHFNSEHRST